MCMRFTTWIFLSRAKWAGTKTKKLQKQRVDEVLTYTAYEGDHKLNDEHAAKNVRSYDWKDSLLFCVDVMKAENTATCTI